MLGDGPASVLCDQEEDLHRRDRPLAADVADGDRVCSGHLER